jgi:3-hydroxybutyryl-CoA dehydratase
MEPQSLQRRGLYFEEFEVGMRIVSPGRTITEADVVNFAGISGDFNSIHTDAQYSESTFFGKRVAHGLLCLSVVSGLGVRTGILEGTVIAFREIGEWKFSQPVFIGDTIHVELEVVETKPMPRLGGGSLTLRAVAKNQEDTKVMSGTWIVLMQRRPEETT